MTEQIRQYARDTAAYLQAVWNATSAGDPESNDTRKENFQRLVRILNTQQGNLDAVNAELAELLSGTTPEEDRVQINTLIGLYATLRGTIDTLDDHAETAEEIANGVQHELFLRITNAPRDRANYEGAEAPGVMDDNDIEGGTDVGVRIHTFRNRTLTQEQVRGVLEHWIAGHDEGSEQTGHREAVRALRSALNIRDGESLDDYNLDDPTKYLTALNVFRRVHGVEGQDTATIDRATNQALMRQRFNYFYNGQEEVREFTEASMEGASDFIQRLRGDGAARPPAPTPARDPEARSEGSAEGALGGIGNQLQDWWGSITEMAQNTNPGGWLGGVIGAAIAFFASGIFSGGNGIMRMVLMALMVPMMFILGRQMGQGWNIGGDNAADGEGQSAGQGPERVREQALAQGGETQELLVRTNTDTLSPGDVVRMLSQSQVRVEELNASLPDVAPTMPILKVETTQDLPVRAATQ